MLEPTDIKKLFAVLQAHYGHKWTTAYDNPEIMKIAVNEWHRVLKGFRPEDIRRGLEQWAGEWPPTLPEFARCCLPSMAELGIDIERKVRRRLPQYTYVAQNSREESQRDRREAEIREEVEAEAIIEALRTIQTVGIEAAKEALASPNVHALLGMKYERD